MDVIGEGLVGGGGVEAVRPPALVERAVHKEGAVVQLEAQDALCIRPFADLAHRTVALHVVHDLAVNTQADLQVIEERVFGAPEMGVGKGNLGRSAGQGLGGRHHFPGVEQLGFHNTARHSFRLNADAARIQVGCGPQPRDVLLGYGFQPDRLPDARHGGVPDAAGLAHLLATGLEAGVGAVPDADGQGVLAGLQRIGDVQAERGVTARVAAGQDAVDPDVGFPVHGAEVQQDALSAPSLRDGETAAIPEVVVLADRAAHAGQAGFDAERYENLSVRLLISCADRQYGIIPQAVEVHPLGPLHQRARIFGQGRLRVHLFGPGGPDVVADGLPALCEGTQKGCAEEDAEK